MTITDTLSKRVAKAMGYRVLLNDVGDPWQEMGPETAPCHSMPLKDFEHDERTQPEMLRWLLARRCGPIKLCVDEDLVEGGSTVERPYLYSTGASINEVLCSLILKEDAI